MAPSVDNVFGRSQYHRMMSFATSELDNAVTAVSFNVRFYNGKEIEKEKAARKTFDDKVAKVLEHILENDGNPVEWICEPHRTIRDLPPPTSSSAGHCGLPMR